jgi:hypothetical protein
MAVKLSVGLQKKVGQPDYGSFGASCHVEFEIDRSMLDQDMDGFHQKIADAFAACRQAVNDQLAQQSGHSSSNGNGHAGNHSSRNGHSHTNGNGNGARQEVSSATQSQVRAIFAIARRHRLDPNSVVQERFHLNRVEDLSIQEASSLIDELKRRTTEVPS